MFFPPAIYDLPGGEIKERCFQAEKVGGGGELYPGGRTKQCTVIEPRRVQRLFAKEMVLKN